MMKRKSVEPEPVGDVNANAAAAVPDAAPTAPPPAKKKRVTQPVGNLTNAQKRQLCVQFAQHKMTQQELCQWAKREFRLANLPHQSTISKILARAPELTTMSAKDLSARRRGLVTHPELDTALCNWVLAAKHRRLKLSGDIIKEQARRLAAQLGLASSMTFSNGWLGGFKKRHNIRLHSAGGSSSPSTTSSTTSSNAAAAPATVEQLQQLARLYAPRDVFAMAETGLFFELSPEKPAGRGGRAKLAASTSSGSGNGSGGAAQTKPRLTLVLCVNADASERLEPMFIGPGKLPKTQTLIQDELDPDVRNFYYQNNRKAWMTPVLFQDWVAALDTRMRDHNRAILLLVSAAPTHIPDGLELTHVRLEVLPPSACGSLHPLEAGIVPAFKRRYRRYHMCHALDRHEAELHDVFAVDQLQAMRWTRYCWRDLPDHVIRHYWDATELLLAPPPPVEASAALANAEEEIDKEICDTVAALDVLRPMMIDEFISPVDENAAIHCAGTDDGDFVYTVPDYTPDPEEAKPAKKSSAAAAASASASAGSAGPAPSAGPTVLNRMTPRLQELHNRSNSAALAARSAATGNASADAAKATPLTAVTGPASLALDPTTLAGLAQANAEAAAAAVLRSANPATNEQLLECFKVLLPELDRLRFDDHTKKSIRATFRKLKDAVEHPLGHPPSKHQRKSAAVSTTSPAGVMEPASAGVQPAMGGYQPQQGLAPPMASYSPHQQLAFMAPYGQPPQQQQQQQQMDGVIPVSETIL